MENKLIICFKASSAFSETKLKKKKEIIELKFPPFPI